MKCMDDKSPSVYYTEAHNVIRPDQTKKSYPTALIWHTYFDRTWSGKGVTFRLSKWDPDKKKYLGDEHYWESTQEVLRKLLEEKQVPFVEADGEAAFYGPKIDIQAKNVYGKKIP